jgi:hypothetical protein
MSQNPTCDRLIDGVKCKLGEDAHRLGLRLTEMPSSRHAWGDIIRCPNDGCGREFMIANLDKIQARVDEVAQRLVAAFDNATNSPNPITPWDEMPAFSKARWRAVAREALCIRTVEIEAYQKEVRES